MIKLPTWTINKLWGKLLFAGSKCLSLLICMEMNICTATQKVIVWDFTLSCLTSEDVYWEDLRWSEITAINNIVWLSAFWLLDATKPGDGEREQRMLPSLPLRCDSPQAVVGIAWSHAATLNLLLRGRSSVRRFVAIHHLGVTGLEECTCCRCTGEQWVISPLCRGQLWHQPSGEPCSWCPQVTLDFWLSEQTAAGQQGVKLSAHLLIRPEESCGAHPHAGLGQVLSFSFLSLILSKCWLTLLSVDGRL